MVERYLLNPDNEESLWQQLDNNGNGIVSLAEIDLFVSTKYKVLDHKPALIRAYVKTVNRNPDNFVHRSEFTDLMKNIIYYNHLFDVFNKFDVDHDHRISLEEFKAGFDKLHESKFLKDIPAFQEFSNNYKKVFETLDANNGGYVLFDEFCS
jgi:Ca2+-binding EF-hand superfamily protein